MPTLRSLITTAVFAAGLSVCQADNTTDEVQKLLTEAQTAYNRGDLEAAKRDFELVYQIDPRNKLAINYLRQIKVREKAGGDSMNQQRGLAGVIIPKVAFHEATFGSVVDAMRKKIEEASGGRVAVSFVLQVPPEVQNQRVTLNLTQVPATEVIRYLGELANVNFIYDRYAIVVRPKAGSVAPAPAPAAIETKSEPPPEQPAKL